MTLRNLLDAIDAQETLVANRLAKAADTLRADITAVLVRDADTEAERDLPVPTVLHTRLDTGVTTLFGTCPLCDESLGVQGHNDCDCPQCGEFACSSFGCGACDRKGDYDR